ncbi:MAG TPA: hypothetical protein DD735_01155 [Clostridiales bacterium]|nr:hypothetical protein [Clostridiales bacterium]
MDKIMDIYIAKANAPYSEACANLSLPAMPLELFDALDKARVQQGDEMYFEVSDYHAFEYMEPYITDADNIVELNVLCQKLSELDDRQSAAFEGLLNMEIAKKDGPISLGKLIDLAYSTDCCHVVEGALNDEALGRFYAENGFLSSVDALPENTFNMLNFVYIGKEMRQCEGGVFTEHGYVVQHSELNEVYKDMSFRVGTPDYQILLELADGSRVGLPCAELPKTSYHACVDCRIPQLMAAIGISDIETVNDFAEMLQSMGDKPVRKYKAVLYATGCNSLEKAVLLAGHTDEFLFNEKISSFYELALDEMKLMMPDEDAALLAQFTNLHSYGMALMKRDNAAISQYGLVKRSDHQPIQTTIEQPEHGGMEMM